LRICIFISGLKGLRHENPGEIHGLPNMPPKQWPYPEGIQPYEIVDGRVHVVATFQNPLQNLDIPITPDTPFPNNPSLVGTVPPQFIPTSPSPFPSPLTLMESAI